MTGESGNFSYTVGHERIPDNFYKHAIGDEYSIPGFLADVVDYAEKYPSLLDIGGNTGTADSFTPIDIGSLTKGVFDAGTLLEGNSLECFVFQISLAALPDVASGASSNIGNLIQPLSDTVTHNLRVLKSDNMMFILDTTVPMVAKVIKLKAYLWAFEVSGFEGS